MSKTKRYFEKVIPQMTVEDLVKEGFSYEIAVWLKSIFNY